MRAKQHNPNLARNILAMPYPVCRFVNARVDDVSVATRRLAVRNCDGSVLIETSLLIKFTTSAVSRRNKSITCAG